MGVFENLTGKIFGRLTVVERGPSTLRGQTRWKCICVCGNTSLVRASNLKRGQTVSCGCFHAERTSRVNRIHGFSSSGGEYEVWKALRRRCNNPNNKLYPGYGGRGIKVCQRWNSFANFIADMGRRPSSDHSIDRINNNGNYEPGNCRWATTAEQAANKRNTFLVEWDGRSVPLVELLREHKPAVHPSTVQARIIAGWSVQDAISVPANARSS